MTQHTNSTLADVATITSDPEELLADTAAAVEGELVEDDLLVEDVSIDGMCGVY